MATHREIVYVRAPDDVVPAASSRCRPVPRLASRWCGSPQLQHDAVHRESQETGKL